MLCAREEPLKYPTKGNQFRYSVRREEREGLTLRSNTESLATSVEYLSTSLNDLILDSNERVVLGNSFRSTRSTGLDLSNTESDDQISDSGAVDSRISF